jgi:hypothetical protein
MRTTRCDAHYGQDTQGREVLRRSNELRESRWFRQYSVSCLDLSQHSTNHSCDDNERRSPRNYRLSRTDIRDTRRALLLDIHQPDFSLSRSHLSICETLDPDAGRKTLLPTCPTPHERSTNSHRNSSETPTDRIRPVG